MERRLPERIATGGLKDLGIEIGVFVDLPLDEDPDTALGGKLGQEFRQDAITKPVETLDLPPEAEVGHHLGGDPADGAERAAGGRMC